MRSDSVQRRPRILLAVSAAAVATIAAGTLGPSPASAATSSTGVSLSASTGVSLSLSPSSGSDFSTDQATLSWTVPSACAGQEVDVFMYPATGRWNIAAIKSAEGLGGQTAALYFYDDTSAASTTGSASWPNVSAGYQSFVGQGPIPSTADFVAAKGTGYYTIAIACVNNTTFAPITTSGGAALAASFVVKLGATGNSWKVSSLVGTQVALRGHATAGTNGHVSLTAHVTASNRRIPAGSVNFYATYQATGTPLNGSTPVPVGSDGTARYAGLNGYGPDAAGGQEYFAQFVPANPARYTPSSEPAVVNLIKEWVTIKVTAKPDPSSATSLDLIAHGTGRPTSLANLANGSGVNFIVDGNVITGHNGSAPAPFPFNANGYASDIITGLTPGTHTVTAELTDSFDNPLNPLVGYKVRVNTVTATTGQGS